MARQNVREMKRISGGKIPSGHGGAVSSKIFVFTPVSRCGRDQVAAFVLQRKSTRDPCEKRHEFQRHNQAM